MARLSALLALVSLLLGACAHLAPYSSIPKSAPLPERIARYVKYEQKTQPLGFPQFGKKKLGLISDVYQLRHFYDASGDTYSAGLMAQWRPYELGAAAGMTLGLGIFLGGLVIEEREGQRPINEGPLWLGIGTVLAAVPLLFWERQHFFAATAKSFNEFMKRDLGLEDVDVSLVPPYQENPAKLAFLRRF